jgi:hypothetical protein
MERFRSKKVIVGAIVALGGTAAWLYAHADGKSDNGPATATHHSAPAHKKDTRIPQIGAAVYEHPGDTKQCGNVTDTFPYSYTERKTTNGNVFYRYTNDAQPAIDGLCHRIWVQQGNTQIRQAK